MKDGKRYVTKAGREWAVSRTQISMRCAVEAGIGPRVAHGVLFLNWPITSNARERAYRWGIAKRVIKVRREREYIDHLASARADAEKLDTEARIAEAVTEDTSQEEPIDGNAVALDLIRQTEEILDASGDPSKAFDLILERARVLEQRAQSKDKSLATDVAREQIETRARENSDRAPPWARDPSKGSK